MTKPECFGLSKVKPADGQCDRCCHFRQCAWILKAEIRRLEAVDRGVIEATERLVEGLGFHVVSETSPKTDKGG